MNTCLVTILFGISAVLTAPFLPVVLPAMGGTFWPPCAHLARLLDLFSCARVTHYGIDPLQHLSSSGGMDYQNDACVSLRWRLSYGQPTGSQSQLRTANIQHFQRPEYAVESSDLTVSGSVLLAFDLSLFYDRSAYCSTF
eukprot:COSAG02_NODE_2842_length_7911_cov_6.273682_4_plen_140_part_00